jgi:hypothetical protein
LTVFSASVYSSRTWRSDVAVQQPKAQPTVNRKDREYEHTFTNAGNENISRESRSLLGWDGSGDFSKRGLGRRVVLWRSREWQQIRRGRSDGGEQSERIGHLQIG